MTTTQESLERYAAKLLFQYRVVTKGASNKRRLCEERIVIVQAETARHALALAKDVGRKAQHSYKNGLGGKVNFQFVGVLDLLHLGVECEENEVWYDITERLMPMERRRKIVPPEHKLNAIAQEIVRA
ncbi:DUF4288 domain-containing protein [Azovibrio restrictus]|uniref:DUF4288 domain-containing protein n=1 Tax=Azovibrio restrictus TaxID=146938 RepID=UPI00047D9944|nr:DUF4288 domain-containing protein [Azovibrio restrictus]